MPTVSAARGCSPTARMRRPMGVLNMTMYETISNGNISHTIRFIWPKELSRPVLQPAEGDVGDRRQVRRRPLLAVDVDVEVPGDAEREEVDRRPTDDLICAQMDCEEGVDERQRPAGHHRDHEPSLPGAGL